MVVWDRKDYLKEAENHLSDENTYAKVDGNPLPELINQISDTLGKMKRKGEIDAKMKEFLTVTEPRWGRF